MPPLSPLPLLFAQVLLFSHSTRLLSLVEAVITRAGYEHLRLDGSTLHASRQQLVGLWRGQRPCAAQPCCYRHRSQTALELHQPGTATARLMCAVLPGSRRCCFHAS
jgi:hypothetical protein